MEIKNLSVQELTVIATYCMQDKREKRVVFNHKELSKLGLKLFMELHPVFEKELKRQEA